MEKVAYFLASCSAACHSILTRFSCSRFIVTISLLVARTLFSCSRFNAILSQLTEDKLERADVHKRHNLAEAHLVHGHSADAEQLHALPDLRLFGS